MKTLKQLWNEKKMALKYGNIKQAVELNSLILRRIKEDTK